MQICDISSDRPPKLGNLSKVGSSWGGATTGTGIRLLPPSEVDNPCVPNAVNIFHVVDFYSCGPIRTDQRVNAGKSSRTFARLYLARTGRTPAKVILKKYHRAAYRSPCRCLVTNFRCARQRRLVSPATRRSHRHVAVNQCSESGCGETHHRHGRKLGGTKDIAEARHDGPMHLCAGRFAVSDLAA
jgi:hypothetical protein